MADKGSDGTAGSGHRHQCFKRGLTLRYLVALVLIAALTLFTGYLFRRIMANIDRLAAVTEVCGLQRLLTQRVLAQCLLLAAADDEEARRDIRGQLLRVAGELEHNHRLLLTDIRDPQALVAGTPELEAIYFAAPYELDKRMRFFIQSIRSFLASDAGRPALSDPRFLDVLVYGERELLHDLGAVVREYQRQASSRLDNLRRLETAATLANLALLLVVGVFLFRPMVRRICRDRIRLEEANAALARLAVTDQLTGASNRLRLGEILPREVRRARRYGHALSVIMCDIDHFKRVNDTKGHAEGDAVLRELVRLVMDHLRDADTLFRYGGEEFLVTLPETDLERGVVVAEKLRRLVAGTVFSQDLTVTISCGVASLAPDEDEAGLMARADAALYRAKAAGRDRVERDPALVLPAGPSPRA